LSLADYFVLHAARINRINRQVQCYRGITAVNRLESKWIVARCRVSRAAKRKALALADYFVLNAARINRINRKIECYRRITAVDALESKWIVARCRVRRAAEGEALSLTNHLILNAARINRINRQVQCYRGITAVDALECKWIITRCRVRRAAEGE
jgi:hypothetical protein